MQAEKQSTQTTVSFFLPTPAKEALDGYISSKHMQFSSWMWAIITHNLEERNVISGDKFLGDWGEPFEAIKRTYTKGKKGGTLRTAIAVNEARHKFIINALDAYVARTSSESWNRSNVLRGWLLEEMERLGIYQKKEFQPTDNFGRRKRKMEAA